MHLIATQHNLILKNSLYNKINSLQISFIINIKHYISTYDMKSIAYNYKEIAKTIFLRVVVNKICVLNYMDDMSQLFKKV